MYFNGALASSAMIWAVETLSFFDFLWSGKITVPSEKSFDHTKYLTLENFGMDSIEDALEKIQGIRCACWKDSLPVYVQW